MRVRLFATLRDLVGTREIDVDIDGATTVRQVFRRLAADYPELGKKLWDSDERLTGLITVLLNGRSLEYLNRVDTPVHPGDDLSLFPPVGGG